MLKKKEGEVKVEGGEIKEVKEEAPKP